MSRQAAKSTPCIEILEEPMQRGTRFRYESEHKGKGILYGENSTGDKKTYPTIRIKNYEGNVYVVVSCVSKNPPYRPHPCQLVTTENKEKGYFYKLYANGRNIVLSDIGIRCPTRCHIVESLEVRQKDQVDPFGTGFEHKRDLEQIDMSCFRMCFQVFIEGKKKGSYNVALTPVVSQPIYDKKFEGPLEIAFVSHNSANMDESKEIIILCEKIRLNDTLVRFFEDKTGWEKYGTTQHHKKVALIVKTPVCDYDEIKNSCNYDDEVSAQVALKRLSDGETSNAYPFNFKPSMNFKLYSSMKKRPTCMESSDSMYAKQFQSERTIGFEETKSDIDSFDRWIPCASTYSQTSRKKDTRYKRDNTSKNLYQHLNIFKDTGCINIKQDQTNLIDDYKAINSWEADLLPQEKLNLPSPLVPQKLLTPSQVKMEDPYLVIREQPMEKGTRFRYKSELKSIACVIGKNSFNRTISYPTVDIVNNNYKGCLIVSCVTESAPYLAHPHKLVGKMAKNGILRCPIYPGQAQVIFKGDLAFGVQCVKKSDMFESLCEREANKIDPFNKGFAHKNNADIIDVTCVRLCFQLFIERDGEKVSLKPIVSKPIMDKKCVIKPAIHRLSHFTSPVCGGTVMCLLCEKVKEDDIVVRFFDKKGWEETIYTPRVHKQVALIFETPKYCEQDIDRHVDVFIELKRLSDDEKSDARPFLFTPNKRQESNKKPKPMNSLSISLSEHLQSKVIEMRNRAESTNNAYFNHSFKNSTISELQNVHTDGVSQIKEADDFIETILRSLSRNDRNKNLFKGVNFDCAFPDTTQVTNTSKNSHQQFNTLYHDANAYMYGEPGTMNNENAYNNMRYFQGIGNI